jgi:zinc protease
MRKALFLLLLFAATSGADAITIPPIEYRHRVLENGLNVYAIQDRATPTVAIHVWYGVGSKHDPEGRSGFAHLFEHMMFKSTKNMPSEMLDRLTEDVGGFNNATTFDDATAYYEVVPSHYLETLLWAEAERMGSLNVDAANFGSERDVVKEEYRFRVLAPPYGLLFNAIPPHSFTRHPYRRPGIGNIAELDAATLEDVRRFHTTWYRPDNATLIVAGDFEPKQLDAWVDRYFADIAKPETAMPSIGVEEPARASEKRVTEYGANVPLPAVVLSWQIPAASHSDAAALAIAATLLAEGESSRLNERLVRGEIAQEIYADADMRRDLGMFLAFAVLGGDHQPSEAEAGIRAEIAELAKSGPGAAELQKAKNLILTSALRERETCNGKAFALGEAILVYGDAAIANNGLTMLQNVTAADVQRVVTKYLTGGKPVVIEYFDESRRAVGGAR